MVTVVTKKNLDGTVETKTTTNKTVEEQLKGEMTWKEKLDAMYPTPSADVVTQGWAEYDEHKFYK